jgi:hypothetical protein
LYLGKHIFSPKVIALNVSRRPKYVSGGYIFRGVYTMPPAMPVLLGKDAISVSQEREKNLLLSIALVTRISVLSFCGAISCGELSITIYHVVGASAAAVAASVPAQITVKSAAVNRVICILGGAIVAGAECRRD